jgi:hypothetical protein
MGAASIAELLLGLTIVLLRGLLGVDPWIHIAMLAVLAFGFGLIFRERGTLRST